ncbi:serine/threonine-protein kinase ICK-like isoform X2 [Hippocampus zosterae]|uniref:serine/threonine-protein kinase ICK-like isoform X2 n=1 Tax=Hippocampus zosterae TaxID=109293 RepID=UPI00223E1A8D|nr:serine/threonine-protein kinase ICK-like isoform X2 [Hippocampus zosterae]
MNRYSTLKQLGDGTYGSVILGRNLESGELVAIKKMKRKFYSWEECMNLREVKSLKKLNHANVIKLKEVIRENDHLYFIFEYMKENLYQLMKDRTRLFPESAVRNIMFQILQGLAFIHKHGFFHRDMKPENLLCMGPELVKIADFGLAREIRSRPPYTDYVSTRWQVNIVLKIHVSLTGKLGGSGLCSFLKRGIQHPVLTIQRHCPRCPECTLPLAPSQLGYVPAHPEEDEQYRAPEVLLRSISYSSPIDQWAVGCIMAELYTLRPLFPGSSEVDTIFKICQVLGTPKKNDWSEGFQLASAMHFRWPQCVPSNLKTLIPNASPEAIHLMTDLLQWDPKKRPTSAQALRYSYFHVGQALGTPQQILEQGRPQSHPFPPPPPLLQSQQTPQQQPLHLRPVPPSQPPPAHNQHCTPSRPVQQLQPSPAPPAAYQRHMELVREQQPKHLLKQEPREGTPQINLPYILDKSKTRQESDNTNPLTYQMKAKGGRRRWGHSTGHLKEDEWDDYEDTELTPSNILGKSNSSKEKFRQADEPLRRYSDILDFSHPNGKEEAPLNLNKASGYQESARTVSAKQHYLRQSRYLPGITTKKNVTINVNKDMSGSHLWGNSSIPFGGTLPSRGLHGTNTIPAGSLPRFYTKDVGSAGHRGHQGPSLESTASNYATWRSTRSQRTPSTNVPNKSPPCLLPRVPVQSIHGRIDWSAKYGHR